MMFTELVDSGANMTRQYKCLVDGDQIAGAIHIHSNLNAATTGCQCSRIELQDFCTYALIDELIEMTSEGIWRCLLVATFLR